MRSYYKVWRKAQTTDHGTSLTINDFGDGELVLVSMPTSKAVMLARHNFLGQYAAIVCERHDGTQQTFSGVDAVLSVFPSEPYRFHAKN